MTDPDTSSDARPGDAWQPSAHGTGTGGLQRQVARGLTWTLIDTWGTQLIGLVIFILLARLLLPVDFGLVSLAAVFVAFAQLFVDQGLGASVIQRPTLTQRQLDTAFWAAVASGLIIAAAGVVLAIPIAILLGDRRLEPILQALSLVFVAAAFSSTQMSLMRREMAFRSLAIRKLIAVALSGIVGVAMAFAGFGAWSLVGQQIANALVSVVVLWTVTPWRPSREFSREDFREMFGFGINVVSGDVLNFISRNLDRLLIGIFLGPVAVGFYAVGYRILDTSQSVLINASRKLIFPTFSRLQHDPERVRRAYSRMNRASSALILPGYVGLALVAQEATVTLFGTKWADSGPVAALLFLIGPVLTMQAFSGALFYAVGHPEVTLRFRLVTTIVNVIGFVIAVVVFRDILAVAAAFVLRGYLLLPLNLVWMRDYAGIPIREHLSELKGVAAATAAMAVTVLLLKVVLAGHVHNAVLLTAEAVIGMIAYGVALRLADRSLVAEIAGLAAQVLPGGSRIARRLGLPKAEGRSRAPQPAATADEELEVDPAGLGPPDDL